MKKWLFESSERRERKSVAVEKFFDCKNELDLLSSSNTPDSLMTFGTDGATTLGRVNIYLASLITMP